MNTNHASDPISDDDEQTLALIRQELEPRLADQVPQFYAQIKEIASRERRRAGSVTSHTTELVNELYLKFVRNHNAAAVNVQHFMGLCAIAIRRLLVDRARHTAHKNGFQHAQQHLHAPSQNSDDLGQSSSVDDATHAEFEILIVHDALKRLSAVNPRMARVAELRWFGGYSDPEIAEILGVNERTARRDWDKAELWLQSALR
jgi:RNA polymerase sigma factor (TIGR02999 family)